MPWKLAQLIPPEDWDRYKRDENGTKNLFFLITYLAPGDYHNFHSPCDWHIQRYRHHSGTLLPVAPVCIIMCDLHLSWNNSKTL